MSYRILHGKSVRDRVMCMYLWAVFCSSLCGLFYTPTADAQAAGAQSTGASQPRTSVPLGLPPASWKPSRDWLLLGIDGELFRPPDTCREAPIKIRLKPFFDKTAMVITDVLHRDERFGDNLFAWVMASGDIVYEPLASRRVSLLAAPRKWEFKDPDGKVLLLSPVGKVLETRQQPRKVRENKPPEGATGWAILCAGDFILSPSPEQEQPENFLWIVPGKEGGFTLVHSGPLHHGTYASIKVNGDIEPGNGDVVPIDVDPQKMWWPYRDGDTDKVIMFPPGYGGVLSRERGYHAFFRGNKPAGDYGPPVQ